MIEVALRECGPRFRLGSFQQKQSSWIFLLWSSWPAIATLMIDRMLLSTIDVTIGSIDSLSPSQCHQCSWVLLSPKHFPAMSGSTKAMAKLTSLTGELVEGFLQTIVATTCDPRILPCCRGHLQITRMTKSSIGAMKYIPTYTTSHFLVEVSLIQFFLCKTQPLQTRGALSSVSEHRDYYCLPYTVSNEAL